MCTQFVGYDSSKNSKICVQRSARALWSARRKTWDQNEVNSEGAFLGPEGAFPRDFECHLRPVTSFSPLVEITQGTANLP